jgi:hypothetical protein
LPKFGAFYGGAMPKQAELTVGRYLQHLALEWMRANDTTAKDLAKRVGVSGAQMHAVVTFGRGAGPKTVRGFAKLLGLEKWDLERDAEQWERAHPVPLDGPVDLDELGPAFREAVERNPSRWTHDDIRAAVAARGSDGFVSMTPEGVADFIDSIAQANKRATREAALVQATPRGRVLALPPKSEPDEVEERRRKSGKKPRKSRPN